MKNTKQCKDCPPGSKRKAKFPGPRCATHHRVVKKARKAHSHELRVQKTYGLGPGDYAKLYILQGGCCVICQRATGKTKRLAVDHDHDTGKVRGLLCGPCNQMLGQAHNDPAFFMRAVSYLNNPPARLLDRPNRNVR